MYVIEEIEKEYKIISTDSELGPYDTLSKLPTQ